MRNLYSRISVSVLVLSFIGGGLLLAAQVPHAPAPSPAQVDTTTPPPPPASVSQILDRVVGREAVLASKMRGLHPIVETYLQSMDKDDALAFHPVSDQYFLGKLDFSAEERQH